MRKLDNVMRKAIQMAVDAPAVTQGVGFCRQCIDYTTWRLAVKK